MTGVESLVLDRVDGFSRIRVLAPHGVLVAVRSVRTANLRCSIMKRRRVVGTVAATLVMGAALAGNARAVVLIYDAPLTGLAENPPNASPATGYSRVTYDTVARTLRVEASFSGLTGTSTLAHIHAPNASQLPQNDPPNPTFGVATPTPFFPGFPIGVTSGNYDSTFDLTLATSWNAPYITNNGGTTAGAEAQLATALAQGRAYFNLHTSTFSGGEIRGFLQLVPEPSSLSVAGITALGALGAARRRRG